MSRCYKELKRFDTLEDRFAYLDLRGSVGETTFGFDRWINQKFYRSREWRNIRQAVILRDDGCDLGIPGYEILGDLLVHHMNPLSVEDISDGAEEILDSEYLITTTINTHNAIHFGNVSLLPKPHVDRIPGDTYLWVPTRRS